MSDHYYDAEGNEVSLDQLCKLEPEWAANRIRVMLADNEALEFWMPLPPVPGPSWPTTNARAYWKHIRMKWASAIHHRREMRPVEPKSRRMCRCGCRKRATHCGTANGVTLYMGCELSVRRWVRDGVNAFRPKRRDQ